MPRAIWPPLASVVVSLLPAWTAAQEDVSPQAQAFRRNNDPVAAISDTTLIAEAEEFRPARPDKPGWLARPFGTNYFAATFANCFLSRQAYLGAPEQCDESVASIEVEVPKAGKYLALVRYESCYRFETQFRLRIEQNGKEMLNRLYGARDNIKIWAFRQKLKKEHAWEWGAGENIVWEGHDAYVTLQPGRATLSLIAGKQPEPAAKRNVDLVMLTTDEAQVKMRIEKENYLPLDGMLTQAGDVYVKIANGGRNPLTVTFPNGTEHSPYWVHIRDWKPKTVKVEPGKGTDWIEVGSLLDTLSNGQWKITAAGDSPYGMEFGVKTAAGKIHSIKKFDKLNGDVTLAYDGGTRYSKRIRLADEVLYDLVDYLKKHPVEGTTPKRTLIYGTTFAPKPKDEKYTRALDEFIKLTGATALGRDNLEELTGDGLIRGYIDVRDIPRPKLEEYCKKLVAAGRANKIAVVSLGDEIGLAQPSPTDYAGFRNWLKSQKIKASEVDPNVGDDYDKIKYLPSPAIINTAPRLYYYSKIYGYRYGIGQLKERTDILRKYLPNAGIGANFSPHHKHMYLGDTHHWISVFREDGMTMPWGEDYIFQVPVGTQQMNFIMVDMFRAAIKNKPERKIHYYVMPHAPNNTPKSWRRQFYGDIAHGVKVFNLFEYRPVQHAYTENHVNDPAMYQEVRKSLHELGKFEDIIQDGQVRPAEVALWCSEAADVWEDHKSPFDAAKRCLYIAIRHQQVPLDFVVDGDDLKPYKVLYLCDQHVSQAGAKAITEWVKAGGTLYATAGGGMFDEFNQPNKTLRELLGVEQKRLDIDKHVIRFEKQDMPFAEPLDHAARFVFEKKEPPAFGVRSIVEARDKNTNVLTRFLKDNAPAKTNIQMVGKGSVSYCAFLPGLSYFAGAFPKRPIDRGANDQSMTHFLPTDFDLDALALMEANVRRAVQCSKHRLVETAVIQAKQGLVIPVINWGPKRIDDCELVIDLPNLAGRLSLASGGKVDVRRVKDKLHVTFTLDVADALILR
jgi:hypothetical protein